MEPNSISNHTTAPANPLIPLGDSERVTVISGSELWKVSQAKFPGLLRNVSSSWKDLINGSRTVRKKR